MLGGILDHLEMGFYLGAARAMGLGMGLSELAQTAVGWASRLDRYGQDTAETAVPEQLRRAERLAERLSSVVPRTDCVHRAVAARLWLARRGIESEIVVGFRRDGTLEGHAWLAYHGPTADRLFYDDDYRVSLRESRLVDRDSADSPDPSA